MRDLPITPLVLLVGFWIAMASPSPVIAGGAILSYDDISPDNSDTDPNDPDGASGGRVNGLAIDPQNPQVMYAASEWGGLYKTADGGLTWDHLGDHLPMATWDVEVDPGTPSRVYATSFFDGRVESRAMINISLNGGTTWSRPAGVAPPDGFCLSALDQAEPSAFGIAIDPDNNNNVYVGTSCGLAISNDSGVSWSYRDPTPPEGSGRRIWDVLVQRGGIIDVCGDDGHQRSTDGGMTWVASTGLPSGRCSMAVSPHESYVLFAVVGTNIFETTDADAPAGGTWTQTRNNLSPQGRIPFVETNRRTAIGQFRPFDLWFGDVSLWRVGCTTPNPPASGGPPRCGTANTPPWAGPFTRSVGGHDDMGGLLFDPKAVNNKCPVLMSSDGGVYYNTDTTDDCHNPDWEQPDVTPHALWPWTMVGVDQDGEGDEAIYFGNQDNGVFGTTNANEAAPDWHNPVCCDGFDTGGDDAGGLYSVCCFGGGRFTRFFRALPGLFNPIELNTYPPGGLAPTFDYPDSIANFGDQRYVMLTRDCTAGSGGCQNADGGVFITENIDANPVVWTELGDATEPTSSLLCGVQVAMEGEVPTFFVQVGSCNSNGIGDRLFRYTGTDPSGTWTQVVLPEGGFGVFAVHPTDPDRLLASGLTNDGGGMFLSTDSGDSWNSLARLDSLMTGAGTFPFRNRRGPTGFTSLIGYWQPSLVAFDAASSLAVAGGQDSGVFLSRDGGNNWQLITDPDTSNTSGTPHLSRPRYGYFDTEAGIDPTLYIGSQGRGIWRLKIAPAEIFSDGFESGDTSAWSSTTP